MLAPNGEFGGVKEFRPGLVVRPTRNRRLPSSASLMQQHVHSVSTDMLGRPLTTLR